MKKGIILTLIIGTIVAGVFLYYRSGGEEKVTPTFSGFLPFEGAPTTPTAPGEEPVSAEEVTRTPSESDADAFVTEAATSTTASFRQFKQVSETAQAGAVFFARGAEYFVRYIEEGTGHVFETDLFGNARRLTNTTVPKIQEVYWNKDGSALVFRHLRGKGNEVVTVQSALAVKEKTAGDTRNGANEPLFTQDAKRLPNETRAIAVSPNRTKLFYLVDEAEGSGAYGIVSDFAAAKQTQVFVSPHQEWFPLWPAEQTIALVSNPSAEAPGALLFLDTKTERATLVMDSVPGLTALVAPDTKRVLYAESARGSFETRLFDVAEHISEEFPVTTLPEKCLFLGGGELACAVPRAIPRESYPDAWYLGLVSFDDDIWKIDIATGKTTQIPFTEELRNARIDAIRLSYDQTTRTLLFTNKKDGSLWSVGL